MILTKEHQEALLSKYSENHNFDECVGFVDGLNAAIDYIIKNASK